jgi:hypothetical protein
MLDAADIHHDSLQSHAFCIDPGLCAAAARHVADWTLRALADDVARATSNPVSRI